MATRGLWANLAMVVSLVSAPAFGQWVGRMDDAYGVRQTAYVSEPTPPGALEPGAPPAPIPSAAAPLPPEMAAVPPGALPDAVHASGPGIPPPTAAPGPAPGPVPGFPPGAPENSPCAADGGGYWCPPNWSWEEGVRVLARSRTRRTNLSYELLPTAPGQTDPITTKGLSFDVGAGYYTTISRYLGLDTSNRDRFFEFSYWGMNEWDDSRAMSGSLLSYDTGVHAGSLMSYFDTIVYSGGQYSTLNGRLSTENEKIISDAFNHSLEHELYYRSHIHNFEANVRLQPRGRPDRLVLYPNGRWRREREPGCYISYLAGLRATTIDERFDFSSRGYTMDESLPNVDRVENSGLYRIATQNRLVGLQIGGDLMFRERLWEFGARYKLGPMLNFAEQTSEIMAEQTTHYTDGSSHSIPADAYRNADKTEVAGMAEIGVEGLYRITPNLIFHAAYDWIFITNLALAPEQVNYGMARQVDGYSSASVNTNGHALYHGLTLSLEFLW
jgi:hypothetical protein